MVRGKTNQEDYRWQLKRKFYGFIWESQGGKGIYNTQGFLWQLLQGASTHQIKSAYRSIQFQALNVTQDLLAGNKRAQGSYLAVASIAQAFPQLQAEVCV